MEREMHRLVSRPMQLIRRRHLEILVLVLPPELTAGHRDVERVVRFLRRFEDRGDGGNRDPGEDEGGDDRQYDLELRVAVELRSLAPGPLTELEDREYEHTF